MKFPASTAHLAAGSPAMRAGRCVPPSPGNIQYWFRESELSFPSSDSVVTRQCKF